MAAVVSNLQHAVITQPWPVRVTAATSLLKIAVRSDEPFRIQVYSFLAGLALPDMLGKACRP